MINTFKIIISDFHNRDLPGPITKRTLEVPMNSKKIISIIGPRRTGKTWYLYSLINELLKKNSREKILYINFEDERLDMDKSHLQLIIDAYQQLYPQIKLSEVYFFLDEIQEIKGWEQFIRRIHDTISNKIFITGSSSKLLGKEIATSLRGRSIPYQLLPFSFKEYLQYHKVDTKNIHSTENINLIISHFDKYLHRGGYPEIFDYDENLFIKTIQSYVDILLYRDIIDRHNIKTIHILKDMLKRLVANNGMIFSINKYYNDSKAQGQKISKDKLYELMNHFEDCYGIMQLFKYSDSVAKQAKALKKVYVNDTGIANALNFSLSTNIGRLLETFVYLELKKRNTNFYYYSNGFETDFLVLDKKEVVSAIQVCYDLNEENKKREIQGILKASERFKESRGIIISYTQEEEIISEKQKIKIIPAWKWALSQDDPHL